MSTNHLFTPLTLRGVTFRNRIGVSPMCMYSSTDGFINDWHLVHLGSRAVGGAGLVFTEATAVEERGRITPQDLGIYREDHIAGLARVTEIIKSHGAVPGIQLAHAGRKASTARPWEGGEPLTQGAWTPVGPSGLAFAPGHAVPEALSRSAIDTVVDAFVTGARRAVEAGFAAAEIHGAHGYLLHEFLSPLSNTRTDDYGGSFENRVRLLLRVVDGVRSVWPQDCPVFVRLSTTDWIEGGWTVDDSVALASLLLAHGADAIDCSSGGNAPHAAIPVGPGFQTPMAQRIRTESGIPTAAVGMITSPEQADHIIRTGQADMALLAREMLRDPYWPAHAASALGQKITPPAQYGRAWA